MKIRDGFRCCPKQWDPTNSIGSPTVRSVFAGARKRGGNPAVVAATAPSTDEAKATAEDLYVI